MNCSRCRISPYIFILIALFSVSLSAANKPKEAAKSKLFINPNQYERYINETSYLSDDSKAVNPLFLQKSASGVSPGYVIGDTWYDYQHNGTIGRMIDWGPYGGNSGDLIIHFGWMYLAASAFVDRSYAYNYYNAQTGLTGSQVVIHSSGEYGGYVNTSVTPDNKGVVGGHNDVGAGAQAEFYFDFSPGFGFFSTSTRVPDSTASYAGNLNQSVIWPKFAYQVGTDTVLHVIAQHSDPNAGNDQAIYYFRKVGFETSGSWDYPPYVIDTITTLSQDIVADRYSDKVALVWAANLRYDSNGDMLPDGVCDTCSGTSPIHVQWDNDIYYQISVDQGQTWNPRVNVTLNRLGEAGFRPYTDLSSTFDSGGNLHIVWSGVNWPEDPVADNWGWDCRVFHWSEDVPVIRTVSNLGDFEPEICVPGAWNINMAKMQVSECDGKMYVLWVQFNRADQLDDCALRADGGAGDIEGAVNGELYFAVSGDGGLNWDAARNLTNSYTPDCDPDGGGADCESDNWPSMTRYGRQNQVGEDWTNAVVVDPSGAYMGDYFLDVQYVHDRDAGGIVQNEGSWQLSNLNWFRLACVEPVPQAGLIYSYTNFPIPAWTQPGVQLDIDIPLENSGNTALTYSIAIEEDNGPSGWIAVSGFSGAIPSGLSNVETGTLHLNNGGLITAEGNYSGRLIFTSNAPSSPDTMEIDLIITTGIEPPWPDTIFSGCLALGVQNTGNYGLSGAGKINLDWNYSGADCDTLADVYLYDASPVILWDTSGLGDYTAAWSIFGDGWLSENGFRPLEAGESGSLGDADYYSTGTFVTQDSTIALERTFYANTDPLDCDYMVQRLKIWSYDGQAHNGLRIGEAIDWDIPSDTGAFNTSDFDVPRNLIYQIGAEYDDDPGECQESSTRFGGIAFLKSFLNGVERSSVPYSMYTARNDSLVFPTGNFVPDELWEHMGWSGFTSETAATDLHTVVCFEPNFNLGATDTVEFFTVIATVMNGTVSDLTQAVDDATIWTVDNQYFSTDTSCCIIKGDVDNSGEVDIADLVRMVCCMFGICMDCFDCPEVWDIDASGGPIPIDIADLVYMVSYMFSGGPPPVPCQ